MQMGFSQRQNQNQSQKMAQTQTMRLNQRQIQSLKLLSLASADLVEEIAKFSDRNPALEVEEPGFSSAQAESKLLSRKDRFDGFSDYERYSSSGRDDESDAFQAALESNADDRETLSDHLLHQLNSMNISESKVEYCKKLIENLDGNGFHILSVESIFKGKNRKFMEECLDIVQRLDPVGTCCSSFEESLFVQAKIMADDEPVPDSALFILNGHFDMLDPPQVPKITKKINRYIESQKNLKFANEDQKTEKLPDFFSESDVEEALSFIKRLDPYPARNFTSSKINFVTPDVRVERIPDSEVEDGGLPFRISVSNETLPLLRLSKSYERFSEKMNSIPDDKRSEKQKAEANFSKDAIQSAKAFIDSVNFRESTLARAASEIVRSQLQFFLKGPRFLVPLRQKDVADALGLDASTISRMANEKYLSCDWGLFDFAYFFTNAVNASTVQKQKVLESSGLDSAPVSKEGVKFEIAKLLEEHKDDKKRLSDQKIADLLLERGVKVARRTVAKYRTELNIDSSYSR